MTVRDHNELHNKGVLSNFQIETIFDSVHGSKIEAIRRLRQVYGFSLVPAKILIDNIIAKRAFKARLDSAIKEYLEETEHQMPANYWLQFVGVEDILQDFNLFFDVWASWEGKEGKPPNVFTPSNRVGVQNSVRKYKGPKDEEEDHQKRSDIEVLAEIELNGPRFEAQGKKGK